MTSSGTLQVKEKLAYNVQQSYDLTNMAEDSPKEGSPKTANTTLRVRIIDVNDNSPVFTTSPVGSILINETDSPSNLFTIEAKDDDAGLNAQISYRIASTNSSMKFTIDAQNQLGTESK